MNTAAAIADPLRRQASPSWMNQASEMAVALWAWWSFVRMAFLELIASRAGKARRAQNAGEVGSQFLPILSVTRGAHAE
jgi:hypothetical protein